MIHHIRFLSLLPLLGIAAANANDTPTLCEAVSSLLPALVSYPGSTVYNASQTAYYAYQERELTPACVFRPSNATEISQMIKLVNSSSGDFAIRGGGHTLWSGAANLDGGLVVDMRGLNSFSLSQDKMTATLGGGSIWSDVYPQLTEYELAVSGARVPGIAMGWLGGGKIPIFHSWKYLSCTDCRFIGGEGIFARSHGWGCDLVRGYEVVLSDGSIVYASATSHSDLWLALKGGSNNFGIITSFDLETIPQGQLWGGEVAFNYSQEALDVQANAFSDFMGPDNTDYSGECSR